MNDREDSATMRYQILKSVIVVEYAEGLINRINPLLAGASHCIRREKSNTEITIENENRHCS